MIYVSTYINMEKLNSGYGFEINDSVFDYVGTRSGGYSAGVSIDEDEELSGNGTTSPRHRYINSEDSLSLVFSEIVGGGSICGVMLVVVVVVVGVCRRCWWKRW